MSCNLKAGDVVMGWQKEAYQIVDNESGAENAYNNFLLVSLKNYKVVDTAFELEDIEMSGYVKIIDRDEVDLKFSVGIA